MARDQVASLLPKGGRVFFTCGATEALNWALRGFGEGGIALAETEHAAVRDTAAWMERQGRAVTYLPVRSDGLVDVDAPLPAGTRLIAVMQINNEIGVIQAIPELAERARASGALFLCDAVQGFGRVPIADGPDMIAVSAHKIHGPKGIGALWVRDGVTLDPLLYGGGQEGGLRSGTLSPMLCAGFGAAAQCAAERMAADRTHVEALWQSALAMLPAGWVINGSQDQRYHGNLNIRFDGIDAGRLISEVRGVAFSAGSACASGSGRPSHVLRALGLTDAQARSSIRLGFGRYTTQDDLKRALGLIFDAAAHQGNPV